MAGQQDAHGAEAVDIRRKRPALVLVDIQRKFIAEPGNLRDTMTSRLGLVNDALDLFRSTGNPVVFIFFDGPCHGLEKKIDRPDDLLDGLVVEEGDHVVHKRFMNCFRDSGLGDLLRRLECDSVVICGMVAQYCVISTYYGAFDHDLTPYMLKGAIAASDERNVERVEGLCKVVTLDELRGNPRFSAGARRTG